MGKVAWQLSLELRKVSGDHGDVESGKNRLLGLAIEQETECGVKPTLWRIPPRNHSFVCLFAHRYMMTALATCFADHHFEFEWIAVADLVDLDHSGLRHCRFVCRASCRLDRRTTLPRQVESGLAKCSCPGHVFRRYPSRKLPVIVLRRGPINVRFTPKSGHHRSANKCPLCAKSELMHCSKECRS